MSHSSHTSCLVAPAPSTHTRHAHAAAPILHPWYPGVRARAAVVLAATRRPHCCPANAVAVAVPCTLITGSRPLPLPRMHPLVHHCYATAQASAQAPTILRSPRGVATTRYHTLPPSLPPLYAAPTPRVHGVSPVPCRGRCHTAVVRNCTPACACTCADAPRPLPPPYHHHHH